MIAVADISRHVDSRKAAAGFIHPWMLSRDIVRFETCCQDKHGPLFMTMFDGMFCIFCLPDIFQVRLSLKLSPDMEIPVGIYSKTTRDLAGFGLYFFGGQMSGTVQQNVGILIWSPTLPPHFVTLIVGVVSFPVPSWRTCPRCEFSTVEKTVEIGSGTLAILLIFNTYGARGSFSFEVDFNTCQFNADCASWCSIEAIPSETRKTDKVMLDRTYYAKLGENLGTGAGMKVCLGANFNNLQRHFHVLKPSLQQTFKWEQIVNSGRTTKREKR